MSFDMFFARPDPSGRTVEQRNPFTGEVGAVPAMLALSPDAFTELAARLHGLGVGDAPEPGDLAVRSESNGWEFDLDPEGGGACLRRVTPESLAMVLTVLRAIVDHGYAVFAPGVDSNRPEPLDEQLFKALGLNADHAAQVRSHYQQGSD
jgi:hypothetical protein